MAWNDSSRAIAGTAVTASDTNPNEYDALYVGTGGTVAIILAGDTEVINTLSEIGDLAYKGKEFVRLGKLKELKILDICLKNMKNYLLQN